MYSFHLKFILIKQGNAIKEFIKMPVNVISKMLISFIIKLGTL